MAFHIKHGPTFFRRSGAYPSEVQFFRLRWGTRRADDVGAGKAKLSLTYDRKRVGLGLEWRKEGERKGSVVLLLGRLSLRLGIRQASSLAVRQRCGVV